MEASIAKLEERLGSTNDAVGKLEGRVCVLEDKVHTINLHEIEQTNQLTNLIATAVAQGNKSLEMKFNEYMETNDQRIKILEDREAQKELAELREKAAEKKADKKHIRNLIIACVITFVGGIVLNNIVQLIAQLIFGLFPP